MDNPRPEKVAVVDEVKERFSAASAALLTEYRGLDVAAISQLRRSLREAGGEYKIYKNTLVRFAARDLGLEIDELLTGPTAIAFVDGDAAAVAKALRDSARTNPDAGRQGRPARHEGTHCGRGPRHSPTCRPAMCCWANWPGRWRRRCSSSPGLLQALPRNFAYGLKALLDERGGVPEPASRAEEPRPKQPSRSTRRRAEPEASNRDRSNRRERNAGGRARRRH